MSGRARVGILISGRGSNMVALVEAMRQRDLGADPALVVSNVPGAGGLEHARNLGVAAVTIDHRRHKPRAAHESRVVEVLRERGVDLVCLAGYMRLLGPTMIDAFPGRILNVHPSLLPAFPGLNAQRQALEYGVRVAGCTVHVVDPLCDHGPIVLQAAVPVREDDTEDTLSERILEQEHRIYPAALELLARERLRIDGRRVHVASG